MIDVLFAAIAAEPLGTAALAIFIALALAGWIGG